MMNFPKSIIILLIYRRSQTEGKGFRFDLFPNEYRGREREKGGEGWRGEEKNRKYISQAVGEPKVGQPQLRFSVDAS